jgi:D-arabinose 1-dehydrogenase-like Zn-dependent alcohol dehydrogenase
MHEMLTLAARLGIRATSESLPMAEANKAVERVRNSDARFRIVLHN